MKQHHKVAAVLASAVVGAGALGVPAASAAERPAAVQHVVGTYALPKGKVISRHRLAIRLRPTTRSKKVGSLRPGAIVDIKCWVNGQSVGGVRRWYRLGISTPEWVSGRYIKIIKGRVTHC
ncbi:SH3 domain-containing protein [Actinomadura roseirufa]|uniref:SH3 domain-containing protein n=1 Tax=Actinomadura roseirufa TaxID=2094049 RepID=UPI001041BBF5|nr:SH3 domain-containing protein [Actinomadura roseirufa]